MTADTIVHAGMDEMNHLPTNLASVVSSLGTLTGLPTDQLRLVLCLFLAIPAGWLHQTIGSVKGRHGYSTILGLLFAYFVVGYGLFYVWIHALVVYMLAYTLPRQRAPLVVFILSVALLSTSHIYRMITDYLGWSFDVTLIQMIYTVKAVTFAYNWADGQALNAKERLHSNPKIHDFRESRALRTYPSLLEYHSYTFFFGGILVGPCFEMREYLEFTERTMFKQADLKSIPSTLNPTLRVLSYAFICYIGVVIAGMYPVHGVLGSAKFNTWDVMTRFLYFWVSVTATRCRYYFAWYLGEAACVASGFGFSGVSRSPSGATIYQWNRACNCHALNVEMATNMPEITNNWNMGVNNWLKNYVYFRIETPRSITKFLPAKSFQNIVTKFTAAAWHGFYGGYYLLFLGAWLVNEMDDVYRAAFEWRVTRCDDNGKVMGYKYPAKYVYNVVGWILTMGCINYLGAAFLLLEITPSLSLWHSLFYFGTLGPLILMFALKPLRKSRQHKKHVELDAHGDQVAPKQEKMEDTGANGHHCNGHKNISPQNGHHKAQSMKAA